MKPYYLHHGDLAPGTAHLRTTIAEGQALMRALRERLSGLALPLYVLDIPGAHGKVPIGPAISRKRSTPATSSRTHTELPTPTWIAARFRSTGRSLSPVAATSDLGQS